MNSSNLLMIQPSKPGMLSPRGQYGLEAKFCGLGLIGFGLGLVLGLVKHWPRSYVSWPRGLNKFLCNTLNEKLETKTMTTPSHCNTGRTTLPLPVTTRENTSLAVHVVQKITIIRAQKIGKFAV